MTTTDYRTHLRALMPGSRALPPAPVPDDHPAVAVALDLTRAVRSTADDVAAILAALTTPELAETALILAAMVPPGTDPDAALMWLDLPAHEWTDGVLAAEHSRWEAGERDATARDAYTAATEPGRDGREEGSPKPYRLTCGDAGSCECWANASRADGPAGPNSRVVPPLTCVRALKRVVGDTGALAVVRRFGVRLSAGSVADRRR